MNFNIKVDTIFKSYYLVMITNFLSWIAWILPLEGPKGFTVGSELTVPSVLLLFIWYGTIILACLMGEIIAQRLPLVNLLKNTSIENFYKLSTFIGFIGLLYTFISITMQDPNLIINSLGNQQMNAVKAMLYENYDVGLHTLRYATVFSGGLGIGYFLCKSYRIRHAVNIILLFINSMIASRLSLILAIFIGVGYWSANTHSRLKLSRLIIGIIVLFLLLTPLNYYRNASYYEYHGIENPLLMNIYEMDKYLGSPFQVFIGSINYGVKYGSPAKDSSDGIIQLILPNFIYKNSFNEYEDYDWYRSFVDVEGTLTTNSVFTYIFGLIGWYAFIYIFFCCFFFVLFGKWLYRHKGSMALSYFLILYACSELWRVYIFSAGMFIFLLLMNIAGSLIKKK